MAAIRSRDGMLAITSGNSLAVVNTRTPDVFHCTNLPSDNNDRTEKKEDEDDVPSGKAGDGTTLVNRTLASAFSGRGQYFALCDDRKMLHVYRTDTQPFTCLSSRLLARRATSLTFTLDEETVLVADKSGDVYSFPTQAEVKDDDGDQMKTQGQLLLGHLSMVLDVVLAGEDRFVATCDRDEKIRLSRYPNAYNIHTYCLGHTQFVSCLTYVEEFRVLISGSGDCSLRVWNMEGKQLCQAQCPVKQTTAAVTAQQEPQPEQDEETGEKNGKEDDREEQERTAIQKLTYCKECRLLVVSFYRLGELQVYRLAVKDGQTTLTLLQTIPVEKDPWDVSYDEKEGVLWVLSPTPNASLSAFKVKATEDEQAAPEDLQLCEVGEEDSKVWQTTRAVNSQGDFFKDSLSVTSFIPTLWKTCRQDNVLEYQQRKQQRLQQQQPQPAQGGHQNKPGRKQRKKQKKGRGSSPAGASATARSEEEEEEEGEDSANKKARLSS